MIDVRRPLFCDGPVRIDLLPRVDADRLRCEEQLVAAGVPMPLYHRTAWTRYRRAARSWFFAVREDGDNCVGGFAAEAVPSRALPGHWIVRAERFGAGLAPRLLTPGVEAITRLARRTGRILRVHVETFSPDAGAREVVAAQLRERGFRPVADLRRYARTIAIDLRPSEDAVLATFHATARRHIRAADKNPVALRAIEDPGWVGRMSDLYRETMSRTGGGSLERDWAGCIELSRRHPDLSRLVGLVRTDATGPESLLAFAWGCHHGDSAHYDASASTRQTDLKVPLAYPLIWDLCRWAKQHGAAWFDFGGITAGSFGSTDRLGGISDFKRYFSKDEWTVGEEWVLEPHWVRSKLARLVSRGAAVATLGRALLRRPRTVAVPVEPVAPNP